MKTIAKKERRRSPRIVLHSAVMDVYDTDIKLQTKHRGRICDVSTLGVKFISNKPYAKESTIYVGLLLPNYNSLINISGKVVRCEQERGEEYNISVEFKEDHYQQSLVLEYIRIMKLWDNQWTGPR
jgi:c-di-GMP-binding flagellar brake protein YcgR